MSGDSGGYPNINIKHPLVRVVICPPCQTYKCLTDIHMGRRDSELAGYQGR